SSKGGANFYFAVISDTHNLNDRESEQEVIFAATAELLNAFVPALDFVIITGDLVDGLPSDDPAYYEQYKCPVDDLAELSKAYKFPVHFVMGNHDYYTGGGILQAITTDKPGREALYKNRLGMPDPYYSFVNKGVRFYCLNSMQQDPAVSWNPNLVGSFGPTQIEWLKKGLADGLPSFLFQHHPLATKKTVSAGFSQFYPFEVPYAPGHFSKYDGSPMQDYTDPIFGVIKANNVQIQADFFGHTHMFMTDEYEGVPLFMTDTMKPPASTEYDGKPMRFHIVECQADTGAFSIYNAYMIKYADI
ncbi:MAG: metallophosphoesterase, partial [Myxococcota bacterium]